MVFFGVFSRMLRIAFPLQVLASELLALELFKRMLRHPRDSELNYGANIVHGSLRVFKNVVLCGVK